MKFSKGCFIEFERSISRMTLSQPRWNKLYFPFTGIVVFAQRSAGLANMAFIVCKLLLMPHNWLLKGCRIALL